MREDPDVDQSKRATLRRFAALGAASPLVGLASAEESDSDTPEAIVGYLSTTPGAHFSKIRDDLHLGTGETQHHLDELESDGAIESRKDGDYRRYFPAGQFSEFEQTALGQLRRETPRQVVIVLLEAPDATAGEIADRVGVSRPTVSNCAKRLESAGLLSRNGGYSLIDPETVLLLLVRYADSFGEDAAAFAETAPSLVEYTGK
ncbi:MarR family transcriptional regulator [Halovenus sp. WSH3]|uniref:MarR family transcriptional regulator n=1 Tax=Halovenus carboxidivorans TaxID=2692199 RepID=A0A6B0T0T1_9EURY|nr:winged helix-turn-helix transcriptional regulator [Halovenus carboxidivorans]MXR51485.1 MarR family transcriptional regulator [Halovenus carboxidivorans]